MRGTSYRLTFDSNSGNCSGSATVTGSVSYETNGAGGTFASSSTEAACSWVVWQVQAFNTAGSNGWATATVVVPDVRNVPFAWHVIRGVGGMAVYGGPGNCGVAQYLGCSTSPGAGTRLTPGTSVGVRTQD